MPAYEIVKSINTTFIAMPFKSQQNSDKTIIYPTYADGEHDKARPPNQNSMEDINQFNQYTIRKNE